MLYTCCCTHVVRTALYAPNQGGCMLDTQGLTYACNHGINRLTPNDERMRLRSCTDCQKHILK